MILRALLFSATLPLLAGCSQSSTERLDPQQQSTLNDIAANTSDTAGSQATQNRSAADIGQVYRSGASAPPRRY